MEFVDLKTQYASAKASVQARINTVLEHGRYILGPEVGELEQKLAEYVGAGQCIGVSSGTDALQIALMALGVASGDEVITTPFSFVATVETIALLGATPVFVDIDPDTYNLDPDLLEKAITPRTKVIMPVSLYGQCADFDAINEIADKHGIPVVEDACQSFGATYKGRRSCGISSIGCTSFFPSKPLGGYGDGGACFTNDEALAQKMRSIRAHGQERRYVHTTLGLNGRLDTLQAAILLAKFEIFPQEVELRAAVGRRYSEQLSDLVKVPHIESFNNSVFAQYTISVENRDVVKQALNDKGIPTAVHYPMPLHLQPAFNGLCRYQELPNAEFAAEHVISLPMHPYLDAEQQDQIVDALQFVFNQES